MVVLVTSFNTGRSRTLLPNMVEREGPTPAPEPCLRCLLVAFSSPLALEMPVVLFRIGSCRVDGLARDDEETVDDGRVGRRKGPLLGREIEKLVCVEENNEESLQES